MSAITDRPLRETQQELDALSAQFDREVPKRTKDNLLIATWNIREYGGLTDEWHSGPKDKPKRDLSSLACISEIVSRFDVVAIQEVQTDIRALRHMLKLLGSDYTVILTDAVEDDEGGGERLSFVFNKKRLDVSGLDCELVVPLNWTKKKKPKTGIDQLALKRQSARTSYAVAFKRNDSTFILVTLHVIWGKGKAGMFDWGETVLAKSGMTKTQKSFRMSDHFPFGWSSRQQTLAGSVRLGLDRTGFHKPRANLPAPKHLNAMTGNRHEATKCMDVGYPGSRGEPSLLAYMASAASLSNCEAS